MRAMPRRSGNLFAQWKCNGAALRRGVRLTQEYDGNFYETLRAHSTEVMANSSVPVHSPVSDSGTRPGGLRHYARPGSSGARRNSADDGSAWKHLSDRLLHQ